MSTIIGDNYSLVSLGTLTFMTPLFFTTLSTSKRKRQAFLPVLKIPMTYGKQKHKATLFGGSGRGVRSRGHDCFVFQVYPTIRRCLQISSCQLLGSYLCFGYICYCQTPCCAVYSQWSNGLFIAPNVIVKWDEDGHCVCSRLSVRLEENNMRYDHKNSLSLSIRRFWGKGERWKRKRERASPPPPSPI